MSGRHACPVLLSARPKQEQVLDTPRRNKAEVFYGLLIPIFCVVQSALLIGFIFAIYVSLEYEKHNAQIRFINIASDLKGVFRADTDALFAASSAGNVQTSPVQIGAVPMSAKIAALLATQDKVLIHAVYGDVTRIYYKGMPATVASELGAKMAADIPAVQKTLDWPEANVLTGETFSTAPLGRFSILAAARRGPFIIDFVFHQLWPFMIGAVALALAIALGAYRFVRRRYDEVERERARFVDFAETSSDWFWEMDEHLRFRYFSHRFAEVTGVPQARLVGKTREEDGNPGATDRDWQQHLADLHAHRPFRDFVHPRTKPDGSEVWLSINGDPAFENGRFCGYRGTGRDITLQRRYEKQLQETKEDAQRANEAKSEFLAAMSHDLRTPLNAILGFADVIRYQYFGTVAGKYREYATDIHASGRVLLSLVDEVLDLSAIEAGKRALKLEPINVQGIINDCRMLLSAKAEAAGVRLSTECIGEARSVIIDERAIRQILQNLMMNAIKFTPAGGDVGLSVWIAPTAATFAVRDTGKGMTPDEITELIEPFSKGRPNAYITEEGWGLGLSIVRSLVALLNGRFVIDSALGRGTTVTVTIPTNGEPYTESSP